MVLSVTSNIWAIWVYGLFSMSLCSSSLEGLSVLRLLAAAQIVLQNLVPYVAVLQYGQFPVGDLRDGDSLVFISQVVINASG
jgi:hypothetical protein